jgi:hypothetical protein
MEIKGKVHLLFEQSGTFKKAFQELGYEAIDYDINNKYGETDVQIDLFCEIQEEYHEWNNTSTIFDNITPDDLVIAFFPCTYFSNFNSLFFTGIHNSFAKKSDREIFEAIIARGEMRNHYWTVLNMLVYICSWRGIRLIIENPSAGGNYLDNNFVLKPAYKDNDRSARGDNFKKPTNYYFLNCEPLNGFTEQKNKNRKKICSLSHGEVAGVCAKERSEISIDYARNFIKDQILGK